MQKVRSVNSFFCRQFSLFFILYCIIIIFIFIYFLSGEYLITSFYSVKMWQFIYCCRKKKMIPFTKMKDVLPKGFIFDCLLEFGIFLPSNECSCQVKMPLIQSGSLQSLFLGFDLHARNCNFLLLHQDLIKPPYLVL